MSQPAPAPRLLVRAGTLQATVDPGSVLTIGRAPTCGLSIPDSKVSRVHVEIRQEHGAWVVRDAGSTNGIHVNGKRLEAFTLDRSLEMVLGPLEDGPTVQIELVAVPVAALGQPVPVAPGLQPVPQPALQPVLQPVSRPVQVTPVVPAPPGPVVPPRPGPLGQPVPAAQPAAQGGERPRYASVNRSDLAMNAGGSGGVVDIGLGRTISGTFGAASGAAGTIGRDPACSIVVSDVLVSRVHARVEVTPDGLLLTDQTSSNGTYLNGRRVSQVWLVENDVVTVGNTDLVVIGGALRAREVPLAGEVRVAVSGIGLTIGGGKRLLQDIGIDLTVGSLTAIVGPSGAGKSTFSRILTGLTAPTEGVVVFDGHDVHEDYELLRSRIGFVPQDDVVHERLTVDQALSYAAELRLPQMNRRERADVVTRVVAELELTGHRSTRVDKLSGGQRKRVSTAIELLTGPELLVLDEPTSGLDPALDLTVMRMLRSLADAGRVVVVVTHSLSYLRECCDNVLLLAPGGQTAFWGGVDELDDVYQGQGWAEIFANVTRDPQGANNAYLARAKQISRAPRVPQAREATLRKAPTHRSSQTWTLVRRQLRLILADPGLLVFLAVLPLVLGVLALIVPGEAGFGVAGIDAPTEAGQLLVLLILGACFMGAALSVRDLVGERAIYHRERAVGLSPVSYVLSKLLVLGLATAVQSILLTGVVRLGKPSPGAGVLIDSGVIELAVVVWLTAWVSAMLGALGSAIVRSSEQTMPLLVVIVMTQLVMSGGMIPVTDRAGLSQLAALFPARWGFAAAASTVDLRTMVPSSQADALWEHASGQWLFNVGVLMVMLVVLTGAIWFKVRLRAPRSQR